MEIATCAECGATAEVEHDHLDKLGIRHDLASMEARCKRWPLPPVEPRGSLGESPTGCPDLDQAALMVIPARDLSC